MIGESNKEWAGSPLSGKFVLFDLDYTMITTVFTNDPPVDEMVFYKKGNEGDNRYSVLRPGIKDLFKLIISKNLKIAVVTNAGRKRVFKILEQFNLLKYVDVIISREVLEEITGMPSGESNKPKALLGGRCLIDDKEGEMIKPFKLRYERNALVYEEENGKISRWNEDNQKKEYDYVISWMSIIESI